MKLILPLLVLLILTSCGDGKMKNEDSNLPSIKDIPNSSWEKLSQKRIYFGHQSVGFNIIEGIKDVMKENPQIKFNIVETSEPEALDNPLFAHSRVGSNKDPKSKTTAFVMLMDEGVGNKADIAFFKFCYVDIGEQTDAREIFTYYKDTLARLRAKYPKTTFVHVTVPLRIVQRGPKVWIKTIINRPIGGYADNINRNRYNDLLRQAYQGKEPIFDLADIESTFSDGSRSSFKANGKTYHSMVSAYTNDGGHLNETGRRLVAEQLLVFLNGLT